MNIYSKTFNYWSNYSNQELDFFSTDTIELYQKNISENYETMKSFNWIDTKFNYKFNSLGFRSDEFTDHSILFLGCSITQGIGMPVEKIFPTLVSRKLDMPCINLGIERTSANTAFRLAYHFLPKLKPKIVVATLLYPHRLELLLPDKAIHFIPNIKYQQRDSYSAKYYVDYYDKWLSSVENSTLNYKKNILAINQLCDLNGIKFVNYTDFIQQDKAASMMLDSTSRARDLVHPGESTHQLLAKQLLEFI